MWVLADPAIAEPLRLRADALAEARSPAGLVVVDARDQERPWLDAEALLWAGGRHDVTTPREWAGLAAHSDADVLVLAMTLREPHGIGELKGGRFVLATGAIRPTHVDGVSLLARTPLGLTFEAAAGSPVLPQTGPRRNDWIAAARMAETVAAASVGVSYFVHSTREGREREEVGADLAVAPFRWLDLAAKGSYDFVSTGIVEGLASAALRADDWRLELFGSHRSPARLLPATSLFSVLGDFPAEALGGTLRWNVAPRLDLLGTIAGQAVGHELGGYATASGTLRFDDRGAGALSLQARHQDVWMARWSGVKLAAFESFARHWRVSTELELADIQRAERAVVRPWGLLALVWSFGCGEVAAAVEGASTPQNRSEVNALLRIAGAFERR